MELIPRIEQETADAPDAAVIWLHGLGADGTDFAPIVPALRLPSTLAIRFIFPHAPDIPVTINGGAVMPAWYDIMDMSIDRQVDVKQLLISAAAIRALVENEISRGIESQRIILAGFSQGGAVVYQTALTFPEPLAGLLAMSTYFATSNSIKTNQVNDQISIEIHHGLHDQVVPETLGKKAEKDLRAMGYAPGYRSYPMEHAVCPQQIDDISRWMQAILAS